MGCWHGLIKAIQIAENRGEMRIMKTVTEGACVRSVIRAVLVRAFVQTVKKLNPEWSDSRVTDRTGNMGDSPTNSVNIILVTRG
jgi:hypothetical protein